MEDLKELVGEELFVQLEEKLGDKKLIINDGNYIPKNKFDEINSAKNEFKQQVGSLSGELEALKKSAKGNDELTAAIQDLQNKNNDWENRYNKSLIDNAVKMEALHNKALDPADLSKFLDYNVLELDETGNVKGLSEQITSLKENKSYLFEVVKQANNNSPANPVNVVVQKDLNEQWQEAIKNGNQALAIALKRQMYNK